MDGTLQSIALQTMSGSRLKEFIAHSPYTIQAKHYGTLAGKIGLEFLAPSNYGLAMKSDFDEIRKFVRQGSVKSLWPIFVGTSGEVSQLHEFNKTECFAYSLSTATSGEVLFALKTATEIYLICLSHAWVEESIAKVLVGQRLTCLHYPDVSCNSRFLDSAR